MGALSFSFVDVLVVVVILISASYAAWRGFVQETLSIFAWVAAAFAALYFGPATVPLLKGLVTGWGALLAAYAGIFLGVVIPLSFISYRFAESVRHSPVQTLDRTLGFAFGVVRGLVIVGALYLVFSMLVPIPRQPRWMTEARLLPLIQSSSQVILAVIPDQKLHSASRNHPMRDIFGSYENRRASGDAETAQRDKTAKKTYGAGERRALDRLIEANGGGQ